MQDTVQCNVYRLGRMFTRVTRELQIRLEAADPTGFIDRLCASLEAVARDPQLLARIKQQSADIVRLAKKVTPSSLRSFCLFLSLQPYANLRVCCMWRFV
jgi:hypothetical protein